MWLKEHGLLSGGGGSSGEGRSEGGSGHGGWLHKHELLSRNTAEHSMADLFRHNEVNMMDYFGKGNSEIKTRSAYATGGNVDTMNTTPSWAQGAPANNAPQALATGGKVGCHSNSVFDEREGTARSNPMFEWTGFNAREM